MRIPSYDNELLHLSEDLAKRLLPAFDTPTGNTICLLFFWNFKEETYEYNLQNSSITFLKIFKY